MSLQLLFEAFWVKSFMLTKFLQLHNTEKERIGLSIQIIKHLALGIR
jgi:hypothetical protein